MCSCTASLFLRGKSMQHFTKMNILKRELAKNVKEQQRNRNDIVGSESGYEQKTDDWETDTSTVLETSFAAWGTYWKQSHKVNEKHGCDKKNADVPEEMTPIKHFTLKKL